MSSVVQPAAPPRSRSRASQRPASSTSRTLSTNVRRLHEALNKILDENTRTYFVHALNDYNSKRNVFYLIQNLAPILNTPEKKQLYVLLGKVIPSSDQTLYWQYVEPLYTGRPLISNTASVAGVSRQDLRHPTEVPQVQRFVDNGSRPPSRVEQPLTHQRNGVVREQTYSKTVKRSMVPQDSQKDIKRVVLKKNDGEEMGLGFSIRGGAEHSVGIFVAHVDPDGYAERKGLAAGDQIVEVNDIPFEDISHGEAVTVLKSARKLVLYVKSVGRVPGSFQSHQTYTWVDPQGRSVSPPPDTIVPDQQQTNGSHRKSGLNLLKNGDEKKVNLVVGDGESLGLMIRGGKEFGLGIYITGIDKFSVAEQAGLKVGDQIVSVNNQSFLLIEHREAVAILKSSKVMIMTIRDIGKLPYARTTVDRTQWLTGEEVDRQQQRQENGLPLPTSSKGSLDSDEEEEADFNSLDGDRPIFSKGIAGSQVMYNSIMKTQGWSMIEEQARYLLNENERGTMMYYLQEYQNKHLNIKQLVNKLLDLLNTHSKFSLLTEVRSFINARDIDTYDNLVLKKELEGMQAKQKGYFVPDRDPLFGEVGSTTSRHSSGSADSRPITPPMVPEKPPPNIRVTHDLDDRSNMIDPRHINNDINGLPDFALPDFAINSSLSSFNKTPPKYSSSPMPPPQKSSTPSATMNHSNLQTVTVDVHRRAESPKSPVGLFSGGSMYGNTKSPSEDSGVDMTLSNITRSTKLSLYTSPHVHANTDSTTEDEGPVSPEISLSPGGTRYTRRERRLSLDSVSTEGSSITSPLEAQKRFSVGSDQGIPRRISDPTHHVPRDQRRNVDQTKKASEQLYELHKQSDDLVSASPKHSSDRSPTSRDSERSKSKDLSKIKSSKRVLSTPPPPPRRSDLYAKKTTARENSGKSWKERTEQFDELAASPRSNKSDDSSRKESEPEDPPPSIFQKFLYKHETRKSLFDDLFNMPPEEAAVSDGDGASVFASNSDTIRRISDEEKSERSTRTEKSSKSSKYAVSHNGDYSFSTGDSFRHNGENSFESYPGSRGSGNSQRSISPAPKEGTVTRLYRQPGPASSQENRKSMEFVDINVDPPVHSKVVEMKKTRPNLGIAVEGGAGTRQPLPKIIKIQTGGSAHTGSNLEVGQVIVSVNSRSLRGLNHMQATRIIAEEFKSKRVRSLEFLVVDSNKYKILY